MTQFSVNGGAALPPPPTPDPTLSVQQDSTPQPVPAESSPYPQPQSTLNDLTPHYAEGGAVHRPRNPRMVPDFDLIHNRRETMNEKPRMILAHMMESELRGLDILQGGRALDPETGLPEYSGVAPLLQNPEVLEVFRQVFDEEKGGAISPETKALAERIDKQFPPSPSHENMPYKEERLLAHEGIKPDTALALIPETLADWIDALRGEIKTNPKTGLPEYFWGTALPIAATLAGGLMGSLDDQDRDSEYRMMLAQRQAMIDAEHRERREKWEKNQRALTDYLRSSREQGLTHERPMPSFAAGGRAYQDQKTVTHAPLRSSGLIKGPGKGQDDEIKTSLPNKSYVLDATTVASLGDGSSEAGAKVFDHFLQVMRKRNAPKKSVRKGTPSHSASSHPGEVPVWVSNEEYAVDPEDVDLFGEGNNEKGGKVLKAFVENVRRHKTSKGTHLPPKTKTLFSYLPKRS